MANSETKTRRFWLSNTLAVWLTGVITLIAAVCFPFLNQDGPDLPSITFISCTLSLGPIIAIWCAVLGGWKAYLTGIVAVLIDGLALCVLGPDWLPLLLPLAVALPCCLTIELIKLLFGEFSKIGPGEQGDFQEGLQFKLSHLFITTTVIAAVCGIGQVVVRLVLIRPIDNGVLMILGIIALVLALNTLLCVWAILGESILWRLIAMLPVAIGLIALGIYLMGLHQSVWSLIFGICLVSTATLLGFLRYEGYRFVRKAISPS